MKGILLISHGPLAQGMYETTKWFMGEDIPQYDYLALLPEDSPERFDAKLAEKIDLLDSGEGVIVIADLMGGTPCNRASFAIANGNVDLLTGMNLALVLQLLGNRLSDNYDIEALVETGKQGVLHVNALFAQAQDDADDE